MSVLGSAVLQIEKRDDGWWIVNAAHDSALARDDGGYGPYETRKQAAEDKRGLELFFREQGTDSVTPAPAASEPGLPALTVQARFLVSDSAVWRGDPLRRRGGKRHLRSAPGQQLLPGFEAD